MVVNRLSFIVTLTTVVLLSGCKPDKNIHQGPAAPVATAKPNTAGPTSSSLGRPLDQAPSKRAKYVAAETGIDQLRIDQPLSASFPEVTLVKGYTTTYFADAQPLEGFTFEKPPVFAVVSGGPFHDFGLSNAPDTKPPKTMVHQAVKLARAGKLKLSMLVTTSAEVKTNEGIGVESTYAALKAAYPQARTLMLPGMWEEPSCLVVPRTASKLNFFLSSCRSGGDGPTIADDATVIRLVVRGTSGED